MAVGVFRDAFDLGGAVSEGPQIEGTELFVAREEGGALQFVADGFVLDGGGALRANGPLPAAILKDHGGDLGFWVANAEAHVFDGEEQLLVGSAVGRSCGAAQGGDHLHPGVHDHKAAGDDQVLFISIQIDLEQVIADRNNKFTTVRPPSRSRTLREAKQNIMIL